MPTDSVNFRPDILLQPQQAEAGSQAPSTGQPASFRGSEVNTDHANREVSHGRARMAVMAFKAAGGATRATAKTIGAVGLIAHGEVTRAAGQAGGVSGGFAVINAGLAAYDGLAATAAIRRGNLAGRLLEQEGDFAAKNRDELKDIQKSLETVRQGQAARVTRVNSGIEFIRSGAEVGKVAADITVKVAEEAAKEAGKEVAKHVGAKVAGTVLGGPASGLASIALGAYAIHQVGKQTKILEGKQAALNDATAALPKHASPEGVGATAKKETKALDQQAASALGKLQDAAKEFKDERDIHLGKTKAAGKAKVGVGTSVLAAFTLGTVAKVCAFTAISVSMPWVGLALIGVGVGVAVYGTVAALRKGRSEQALNAEVQAAIATKGKPGTDGQQRTAVNKAVASLHKTLDLLAKCNGDPHQTETAGKIIQHLSDKRILGTNSDQLRGMLTTLDKNNVDDRREFLLSELTKGMLGATAN